MPIQSLTIALAAFAVLGSPGRITKALQDGGRSAILQATSHLNSEQRADLEHTAERLADEGIQVVMYGDRGYPESLVINGKPIAPIPFYKGNSELFHRPSIGMCGSRNVSELGLKPANSCGVEVANNSMVVVSGYAKGVDTATHLAALESAGARVIVLAEGFDHFRIKQEFKSHFDWRRTLVVSQFAPSQPWKAFAAMARNGIIFGLARALVVIEAGERGGTLAAGEGAMKLGRPVLVLDFGDSTPAGNFKLLNKGARPVHSVNDLRFVLRELPRLRSEPVVEKLF
ncbi:DNA-processing protein DprA [Arthrobacter sp. B1I2]|uniref:DNA-processing protein DprA n=1 Tax=Arthrobacter sp. B1I2 TaxID=3042263 RepID=UPI002785B554|nr:DNA-processing protein DprA [Arthrobacter sp. B1I2]MDQ0731789.1 DNA processing protein [Arthrobacter sp. B1I2]